MLWLTATLEVTSSGSFGLPLFMQAFGATFTSVSEASYAMASPLLVVAPVPAAFLGVMLYDMSTPLSGVSSYSNVERFSASNTSPSAVLREIL